MIKSTIGSAELNSAGLSPEKIPACGAAAILYIILYFIFEEKRRKKERFNDKCNNETELFIDF